MKNLSGAQIAEKLLPLSEKAAAWRLAIARQEPPPGTPAAGPARAGGLFGLMGS